MEKIRIDVEWCNKNFGASFGENVPGAVVFTAKTYDEILKVAEETLRFHVEGMLEDGDEVPQWLRDGDYEFVINNVDVATLLRAQTIPFKRTNRTSHSWIWHASASLCVSMHKLR